MLIKDVPPGSLVETLQKDLFSSVQSLVPSGRFFRKIEVARDGRIICENYFTRNLCHVHQATHVRLVDEAESQP